MAGTVSMTKSYVGPRAAPIRKYRVSWVSAVGGAASGELKISGTDAEDINGEIIRVVTNPGTAAPSDNYGLTLTDEDGVDVLAAAGANRDTANSEQIIPTIPVAVAGPLTLGITAAGDAKAGDVVIYVR